MNKGLEIRNNKLIKNTIKRNVIKPEQIDLCIFVEITYEVIKKVNGKYRHTGSLKAKGLQIKNRVYLTTGSYKLVNGKGVRVKKVLDTIPIWATDELLEKYRKFHQQEKINLNKY